MNSASLIVTVLALGSVAHASADILPPDRRTLWNPGIPGGVPARTTMCATLNAGSSQASIENAIDACPEGQVVQLAAGTFYITGGPLFIHKGITLRGMGAGLTVLKKTSTTNEAAVVIGSRWARAAFSVNLTSNAVKEANSVTVANPSGFSVGQLVLIDRLPISGQSFYSSICGTDCQGWFQRNGRPITQTMEIASIVGNTVGFSTPFHIDFGTAQAAQMTALDQPSVKGAGLEDLKVYGGRGGDGGGNIYLEQAVNSWVARVESHWSLGASVRLYNSLRCTIRDSYFHETANPTPGGDGYGIDISASSADNLIENNISWAFNKVILMRAAGGGNVIAYNYFEDGYGSYYKNFVESGINASHMTSSHYVLFEGNQGFNLDSEGRWGNAIYITFFRNHSTMQRRSLGGLGLTDVGNRQGAKIVGRHYWYSFIGNVFGTPGMSPQPAGSSFVYEKTAQPYDSPGVPIFVIGAPDADNIVGIPANSSDPQVLATLFRAGNYEYGTNAIHWESAAQQTLPDSLYLTSKPAFFGDNPWPWVDPTGGSKLHTLPARARFDQMQGPLKFYTVSPCRVADTRNATGPAGGPALTAGQTRDFQVAGLCGVPLDARAVAANVSIIFAPTVGYVSLFTPGLPPPIASAINVSAARLALGNNTTIGLGTSGAVPGQAVSVLCGIPGGQLHFILDVAGYYK